jgi:hypothetical protein
MIREVSKEIFSLDGRQVKPFRNYDVQKYGLKPLAKLGIEIKNSFLTEMYKGIGMDSLQATVTTPSSPVLIQFLQNFMPGFIEVITAVRRIDELTGITIAGAWEDEEIVQGIKEKTNLAVPYLDYTNVPLASWNVNYEKRTNLNFEQGILIGVREEAQAARIRINTAAEKRESAALGLEIVRNLIGFYGYNSGLNLTYGFLNDPGLPAYNTAPNGASGSSTWASKTYLEIVADLKFMAQTLRIQSQDNIDPLNDETTLGVATAAVDGLSQVSQFGNSVREFIKETYPKMRIVSAPEMSAANAGSNVSYLYADKVRDQSSDGGQTFIQVVPTKFRVLGVEKLAKGYKEDYSNSTAGVWCKRPWAVTRLSGI